MKINEIHCEEGSFWQLPNGVEYPISYPLERVQEIIEQLYPELLTNSRPCQCGSGQPWVNCSVSSQYCG